MKVCFAGNLSSTFVKKDYEILKKHFRVDALKVPHKKFPSIEWLKFLIEVVKKAKRCDIAFSWFAGLYSAFIVFIFKLFRKKSIVVVGGWDAAYVPEINYGAFTNIKEKIPAKYVLENADLLLPVSEFTKKEVLEKVNPKRIKVVYNGVDVERFKMEGNKEDDLIITVGGVSWSNLKRKGIKIFVNTARSFPSIRFVVIGKFIDTSIEHLKKNASKNVEFTGFVSDDELVRWYQRAKVICQLSYYEAFGLAPAEGMACECIPVVTKDKTGMPEFVDNTGFYVPYGDEKATAEAIKKALDAPEEMRKKARERIKNLFSVEKRERKLVEAIKSMVG